MGTEYFGDVCVVVWIPPPVQKLTVLIEVTFFFSGCSKIFLFSFDFQQSVCGTSGCGFLCIRVAWGSLRCLTLLVDASRQIWGILGPPLFLWALCPPHAFPSHPAPDGYVCFCLRCLERPFPSSCLPSVLHRDGLSVGPPLRPLVLSSAVFS